MAELIDQLLWVRLSLRLCNPVHGTSYGNCYCWLVAPTYDFQNGGNVRLTLLQNIESTCTPMTLFQYLRSVSPPYGVQHCTQSMTNDWKRA